MLRLLKTCEERCHALAERHAPSWAPFLRRYSRVWRYLVSGGTAASMDLVLLYLLTDLAGLHYLVSATLAFIAAFCVSFILQKFWTFGDHSVGRVSSQAAVYFAVAVANLALNALLMYFFVETLRLWYLVAQIFAGGLIAIESFFVYRHFIFRLAQQAAGGEDGEEWK